jgi:PAS domain S-box-containing protein
VAESVLKSEETSAEAPKARASNSAFETNRSLEHRSHQDQGQMRHADALPIEPSGFAAWEVNLATAELFLNPRSRRLLGYSQEEPVNLPDCLERVLPEDRRLMLKEFEKSIGPEGEADWNFEIRFAHPERGTLWIAGFGQIERDEDGKAILVCGMAMDLRNSKLLERLHRTSEERYRKLFQSISDAVVIVNMRGNIIECNQAYVELTGYTLEELHRTTYQDLTPEKWHAFEASIVSEQIIPIGYSTTYEKEYRHKDGTIIPIELRTFLVKNSAGTPSQMWAIVRDITKRKASEIMMLEWNRSLEQRVEERTSALRQSRTRFKQLAETTFEAIVICDNEIILDGNTLLVSMFGYHPKELIGRPLADLVANSSKEAVNARLLSGEDGTTEFEALRADGTTFSVEAHSRSAANRRQDLRIIAIRDLTSTRIAESKILAQQAQLDEVQRLALISEIAAGIIHEVGQPLSSMGTNVMTATQGLESCIHAPCPSIRYLCALEADVERMREIVIHMRSLGDPSNAQRRACDLNQIIKNASPILEAATRSRGIQLQFVPAAYLPQVIADSVQLSQVVLNLVRNATEASAEQSTDGKTVTILTDVIERKWVQLTVRDEGPGIPQEVMDRLFIPFLSTKSDGLGIGLRLCRTIVEAHGGSITCFNNPHASGATFLVRLPAQLESGPTIESSHQ